MSSLFGVLAPVSDRNGPSNIGSVSHPFAPGIYEQDLRLECCIMQGQGGSVFVLVVIPIRQGSTAASSDGRRSEGGVTGSSGQRGRGEEAVVAAAYEDVVRQ